MYTVLINFIVCFYYQLLINRYLQYTWYTWRGTACRALLLLLLYCILQYVTFVTSHNFPDLLQFLVNWIIITLRLRPLGVPSMFSTLAVSVAGATSIIARVITGTVLHSCGNWKQQSLSIYNLVFHIISYNVTAPCTYIHIYKFESSQTI